MKKRIPALLAIGCMVFLSACSSGGQTELTAAPTSSTELTSSAEPTSSAESGGETTENIDPKDKISRTLSSAIEQMISQVQCDRSGMTWEFGAENDLRNIYYAILSENPELKYAYDMQVTVSDDTATCNFSYMPYKTGAYDSQQPAGSHTVGSLRNAMIMAQSMIDGTEHLSIAITDPELSVEDIQLTLRQAGYG